MFGNRSSVQKGGLLFVQRIDILSENISTVRVYPQYNYVGVWRLWEAWSCLAEYLIQHSDAVWGRYVMEVGSGMGLTGLVVVWLCRPSHVSLTNFTDACLTNLSHNVEEVNQDWLEGRGVMKGKGGGEPTVVIVPRGLYRWPLFWSMMSCVCPSLLPRAPPQKYLSFTPSWGLALNPSPQRFSVFKRITSNVQPTRNRKRKTTMTTEKGISASRLIHPQL